MPVSRRQGVSRILSITPSTILDSHAAQGTLRSSSHGPQNCPQCGANACLTSNAVSIWRSFPQYISTSETNGTAIVSPVEETEVHHPNGGI